MVYNQKIGKTGEDAVCVYIEKGGGEVLARNYRCAYGEIDVIARQGATICFVEVKTRTSKRYGSAAEAVTPAKMAKIRETALHYIAEHVDSDCNFRFDVAEVYLQNGMPDIHYIENAFC
ncbi:MAG: YraN family protein [Christensenellaceae bacterium]|jgi:putative endonuclease